MYLTQKSFTLASGTKINANLFIPTFIKYQITYLDDLIKDIEKVILEFDEYGNLDSIIFTSIRNILQNIDKYIDSSLSPYKDVLKVSFLQKLNILRAAKTM